MTERKGATVKELRDALIALGPEHDGKEIQAWLPGSQIYFSGPSGNLSIFPIRDWRGDKIMIEGNLVPGSALG